MTAIELTAKRAAIRTYLDASERHAQRAIARFQDGKRDDARVYAHLANDIRRWARAECSE